MKTILRSLGFSSFEVDKLMKEYGAATLRLLSSADGRKQLSAEVEESSVKKAHLELCKIHDAKNLFALLEPCKISKDMIYEFYIMHNENEEECIREIKADPYRLIYEANATFKSAEKLAKAVSYKAPESVRAEAAIYSAMSLIETGMDDADESELGEFIAKRAGSMCLPLSEAIRAADLLLKGKVSSKTLTDAAHSLHRKKMVLLTKKRDKGKSPVMYIYKARAAAIEFYTADRIKERLSLSKDSPLVYRENPFKAIDDAQACLSVSLSYEQSNAVYAALTNRISVITGGPGTGKTATQKVLLESYRRLSGGKQVLLMAPTGQAAKRMTEATGYPASTVHSALGISPFEKDIKAGKDLAPGLIILDEMSMVDGPLFSTLLRHVNKNTLLVLVGDIDQLPSIGSGAILRELIACVPTSRLTKVFRQGDGSDIAFNAARIKVGTAQMIEGEKFSFVEAKGSEEIQKAVCDEYRKQCEAVGEDNVVVLTPYRQSTPTGVNALNKALREALAKDKSKYLKYENIKIYEGDKVIFLRNRFGLVNGEVGYVEKIVADKVKCKFGDKDLTLSGTELSMIVPAYSQTVHKSQGAEYKVVIYVSDSAHSRLASKKIVYTAVTRAKDKLISVGERSSFESAITTPTEERYSNLARIVEE